MTIGDIVTDPFLQSLLIASERTRQQCNVLVDLIESNSSELDQTSSEAVLLETSRQQKNLHSHLAQLRGLNREAVLGVRQTKQATTEARQEVDKLHLQLQNLYYEQKHLRGEIAACEAYDHKYQQLPLISTEEFIQMFPEHKDADEDTLMRARITHEYTERDALEQERQGLLKKKQELIADNKKRRDDLANLDQDLEKFIDAAKPIQKTFQKEY